MPFGKIAKTAVTAATGTTGVGTALATIGSAALGGIGSYFSAKQAQRATKEFYKNRHQWEVEDLKAAGLNPILSAGNTGGATPNMPQANVGAGIQAGISTAKQAKILQSEHDAIEAQIKKDTSQKWTNEWIAENQRWQAHSNFLNGDKVKAETANAKEIGNRYRYENKILAREAFVADVEKSIYEKYPGIIPAEMARRAVFGSGGIGLGIGGFFKGKGPKQYNKQTSRYDQFGGYRGGSTTTFSR